MSADNVSILLVGINGYARGYLDRLLDHGGENGAVIAGIADPTASVSDRYAEILARNIPVYADMADFYREHKADLAIISTPIQLHCQHLQTALAHNSNVLCEKPLCATVDEINRMRQSAAKSDRFVAIGFNWSFSSTIQAIKKDILSGIYGAPKNMKSLVFWPRSRKYYQRNNWAGQQKNARGDWILDSPLSNATSHFLHNILYLCGDTLTAAALPQEVTAELYRANPIDNFDTAAVRLKTVSGVNIHFYTTHAVSLTMNPLSVYEFENGAISHLFGHTDFIGRLNDGTVRRYQTDPYLNSYENKLWQCVKHCRGEGKPVCTLETATALTLTVNAAQMSMPQIVEFPAQLIEKKALPEGDEQTCVSGLIEALLYCYSDSLLPSECGMFDWAKAGKKIDATAIKTFTL